MTTNASYGDPMDVLRAAKRHVEIAGENVAHMCTIAAFEKVRETFPGGHELLVEKKTDVHNATEIVLLAVIGADEKPVWLHDDCDGPGFYVMSVDPDGGRDFSGDRLDAVHGWLREAYDQPGRSVFDTVDHDEAAYVWRPWERNLLRLRHPARHAAGGPAGGAPDRWAALNHTATFLPADCGDAGTLPSIEIGGVQVYAHFEDGRLIISGHLDTAEPDVLDSRGRVPVLVKMGGELVWQSEDPEAAALEEEITRRLQAQQPGEWFTAQWRTEMGHRITMPGDMVRKMLRLEPGEPIRRDWWRQHVMPDTKVLTVWELLHHHVELTHRYLAEVTPADDRLLSADEVQAIGLNPGDRDGHPGFPHRWSNLTYLHRHTLAQMSGTENTPATVPGA